MKRHLLLTICFSFFMFHFSSGVAQAEQVSQSFTMSPGWNAVFLEIEPVSTVPADVFANIKDAATQTQDMSGDLESVWMWNPNTGTVEFIQDPNAMVPGGGPQMLAYIPGDPVISNLHAIFGNTAYLIKLGGTANVILTVNGEPKTHRPNWKSNSFNFVGFHLTEEEEPLFDYFFANSPAHDGQEIYLLDNGQWVKVTNAFIQMKRGEAFWVYCHGSSEFTGPLSVQISQSAGLHYGMSLSEQDVYVHNNSAAEKTVTLSVSSLNDTLHYWVFKPAEFKPVAGWFEFPVSLSLTIPAGESQKLRLGVKRAAKPLSPDTTYQANMEITDNAGMTLLVPVSVTGIDYSGLWVGYTTLNKVNEPANTAVSNDMVVATGSEFSFRLILHVDEDTGVVTLLSQVIQMWQDGTWKSDPNNPGKQVVDDPGYFVLLADDKLIPKYSGSAMRDGQLVGRRISSPVFPNLTVAQGIMSETVESPETPGSVGSFPSPGYELTIGITLVRDNPTNPFMHMFHPDHKVPDEQSYQIDRNITLTFSDDDPEGKPITGVPTLNWGSSEIGGIFRESIIGLHEKTLHTQGTFLLKKVSDIGTLEVSL